MAVQRDTLVLDHDDLIAALIAVRDRTDRRQVAAAFVSSLRAKRLDLRSPLPMSSPRPWARRPAARYVSPRASAASSA